MKKNVDGIEIEMTAEEEAEFLASAPIFEPAPVERVLTRSDLAAGFKAIGFTDQQVDAFCAAVSQS